MTKKRSIAILEFNHSKIRCCQSEISRGSRVIKRCFSVPFIENQTPVSDIRRAFRFHGFKPVQPIVAVPRHMASWQSLRLPSQDDAEIRQMLQCHVSRQFAFSEQGSVFDYQNSGQDTQGYSMVQVCSFSRQKLSAYFDILHALELDPVLVTLNVQGLLQWMLFEPHPKPLPESFCLLNREEEIFDLSVIHSGRLCFSRSFVSSSLLDQSPCLLLRELKVSQESCRRMGLSVPDHILYVSGEMQDLEREYLINQGLEIRPALENQEFFSSFSEEPSFLSCLGLALYPPGEEKVLDLRPREFRETFARKKSERNIFQFIAAFCGLTISLWCLWTGFVLKDAQQARVLKNEWISLSPLYRDMEQKANEIWIREKMLSPDRSSCLMDLYRLELSGVVLIEASLHPLSGMSLKGKAKDTDSVFTFLRSLKSLPSFQKARIDSLAEEKTKDKTWPVSFRIFSRV